MFRRDETGLGGIAYGSEIIGAVLGWTGPAIQAAISASEQFKNQVTNAISGVVANIQAQYDKALRETKSYIDKASAELQVYARQEIDRITAQSKMKIRRLSAETQGMIRNISMLSTSRLGNSSSTYDRVEQLGRQIGQNKSRLMHLQQRLQKL